MAVTVQSPPQDWPVTPSGPNVAPSWCSSKDWTLIIPLQTCISPLTARGALSELSAFGGCAGREGTY